MRVVLAGVGRLSLVLARALESRGHDLVVIEEDRSTAEAMARRLRATVVVGDPTTPETLTDAGIERADEFLSMLPEDHRNLAACQLARSRFRVPRVLAVVSDPDNEEVFRALGVEVAFSPVRVLAGLIEQCAGLDSVVALAPAAGGRVLLSEVLLGEGSAAVGRSLQQLRLPPGALVGCIVRGDDAFVPHGATEVRAGDRAIVLGTREVHADAVRALASPAR